jgi:RNA polymerase sigma-70 factor (ECF subfamily)
MDTDSEQVTLLLQRIHMGDRSAESELLPIVYGQLHRLAERQFRGERPGHTLQPTALMNELYLRILRDSSIDWKSRAHFYAVAAETMRRILVDHARSVNAQRRPQSRRRVDFDEVIAYSDDRADEVLVIADALSKLAAWDRRQAQIVELRFFGGFSIAEIGQALGISDRTVKREWTMARAWLAVALRSRGDHARDSDDEGGAGTPM